jgi:hypothetical protein
MSNSTKVKPLDPKAELGLAALTMVIGLLVVVTLIGGVALRFFSLESDESIGEASALRLQNLARMGLESSFSLLYSMGTITNLQTSYTLVGDSENTISREVENCNYFPRTDDALNLGLVSDVSVNCLNANPTSEYLSPRQYARGDFAPGSNSFFRSIFPWTRYQSTEVMNSVYEQSEDVQLQINQCGLSSQFNTTGGNTSMPLQRYRYQQDFQGLGSDWLDLGKTNMNIYANGLTLEAWVWMSKEDAGRQWQRIFDIASGQAQNNIVLAYDPISGSDFDSGNTNLNLHMFGPGFNFYMQNNFGTFPVPVNNQEVNDLWYYIAAVIEPASFQNPRVKIYTKCERTNSDQDPLQPGCGSGLLISGNGWSGLYLRNPPSELSSQTIDWQTYSSVLDSSYERKTWVGKSFWPDFEFKGKMRDLRVWDRALTEEELNLPIKVSYSSDTRQSSIITETNKRESLRISPIYKFGNDRLMYFTVKETEPSLKNTWRLVSCAWNPETRRRRSQSLRFRVLGTRRPEVTEYFPY